MPVGNIWNDIHFIRELFYVTVALAIIIVLVVSRSYMKIKREQNRIAQYTIHATAIIDDTIPALLESICQETFNDYIILNAELFGVSYIDEKLETRIQKEVLTKVSKRISPAALDKLSLYYNPKFLDEIIARKVVALVTEFVVETNSIKNELPDTKIQG